MARTPHPIFTKEMKKEYTLLIPTMLPMHFKIISKIVHSFGYKAELLENSGKSVTEHGLKYVHNDTCYPAILVIGQFLDALDSGRYDPHKVALLISQTGGGCRASNYISLLRKALDKAGYGYVPVVSFNLAGLEKSPGFTLTLPLLHRLLYAVLYGDLLMLLKNQCRPYEIHPGDSERLADKWVNKIIAQMEHTRLVHYRQVKRNYAAIIRDFAAIPKQGQPKIKVGIVGEIFVKFSPLGNNNLEDFLLSEGAETVMPGLLDFCLYSLYNGVVDQQLYHMRPVKAAVSKLAFKFLIHKKKEMIRLIEEDGHFTPPSSFANVPQLADGYIGLGAKMGEGWLLTAEMLELIEQGVDNIVCTQPFGCLPNHIVGKGMMKHIKEMHPTANIVAIDYDAGAPQINQENRVKLMLANARTANRPAETASKVSDEALGQAVTQTA